MEVWLCFFLFSNSSNMREIGFLKEAVSPDVSRYQDEIDSSVLIEVIDLEDSLDGYTINLSRYKPVS